MSDTPAAAETAKAPPGLLRILTPRTGLLLGFTLVTTSTMSMVLPFFAIYFTRTLHLSIAESGFLTGLPFLAGLSFGLIGGLVSDRIGAARTYVLANAVFAIAVAAIGMVHSVPSLVVAMLVMGLTIPVISTSARALLNQESPPELRGAFQNYLYWVSNMGAAGGLLLSAGLLHAGDSPVPYLVVGTVRALLCVGALIGFWRAVVQVGRKADGTTPPRAGVGRTLRLVGSDRSLLYAALTLLLLLVMEAQIIVTLPIDFAHRVPGGVSLLGPVLAINSVVVVLLQPPAMRLTAKRGAVSVFLVGSLMTGLGFAVGGILGTLWSWVVGMVLYSVGEVLWSSKLNALLGEIPTAENAGLYFAVFVTSQNLAMFLGTTFGSALYQAFSPAVLFGSMIAVAMAAVYTFQQATRAYGQRVAAGLAAQGLRVALPGSTEKAEAAPVAREELPDALLHGAASYVSPATQAPLFGLPTRADRLVLLESLSAEEWQEILDRTETVAFTAGETLLRHGEQDRSMYIVLRGEMEVRAPQIAGAEQTLARIEEGSVFGEQAFLDGRPRSASVRARTDGELRRLDWIAFRALSEANPGLSQRILEDLARILSERLRRTTEALRLLQAV